MGPPVPVRTSSASAILRAPSHSPRTLLGRFDDGEFDVGDDLLLGSSFNVVTQVPTAQQIISCRLRRGEDGGREQRRALLDLRAVGG